MSSKVPSSKCSKCTVISALSSRSLFLTPAARRWQWIAAPALFFAPPPRKKRSCAQGSHGHRLFSTPSRLARGYNQPVHGLR